MNRAAELRALDGRLCRLAEELNNPAAPESAKTQINTEIRRLMTRRAELVKPPRPVLTGVPFRAGESR